METGAAEQRSGERGAALAAALAASLLPAAGFVLLLAAPDLDVRWEHHPSHFWLVVLAAAMTAVLAYATGDSADRRGDARLFLVSLAFLAAGGFLALHALATPEIFLERSNLGFQVASPVGLVIASAFALASTSPSAAPGVATMRSGPRRTRGALLALMLAWALATVIGLTPLDRVTQVERASGPIAVPAVAGAVLFAIAAVRYLALGVRRAQPLPLAVGTGFVLLGEALLATAFARNWHATWWEWHVLILTAFAIVAWAARREWREERFAALYTDETARGSREITVLFADLAGFAGFSEERDPGEVSAMLNAYFEVAIPPIVREHGGEVDRLIGDALMATFKSPPDEPDHALRAARAAISLRDRTAALAADHPDWPRFRIGVNTGAAMVGVLGAGGGPATPRSAMPSTSRRAWSPRRRWAGSRSGRRRCAGCRRLGWSASAPYRSRASGSRWRRSCSWSCEAPFRGPQPPATAGRICTSSPSATGVSSPSPKRMSSPPT